MELRTLRYFLMVAREGSFTRAAEKLFVTQPTLSKQLGELETSLGHRLFIRGTRQVTLTPEGVRLRQRAEEILSLVERTQAELASEDSALAGEVTIGAGETHAMRFLAKAAKQLQTRHPAIRYALFSGNAPAVTEQLDRGLLDFGLFIEPADLSRYDYLHLPLRDTWGVVLRKDHPLAQKPAIAPADLREEPLLCSRQSLAHNELAGWAGVPFDQWNLVATYNLIYNAAAWVTEGLGIALALEHLVDISEGSPLCFRPLTPALEVRVALGWKKHTPLSPAAQAFLDAVRAAL